MLDKIYTCQECKKLIINGQGHHVFCPHVPNHEENEAGYLAMVQIWIKEADMVPSLVRVA